MVIGALSRNGRNQEKQLLRAPSVTTLFERIFDL